jgi:hypothetical protein
VTAPYGQAGLRHKGAHHARNHDLGGGPRLLKLHVERRGDISVDDSNRAAYRDLAVAGLMVVGHSFTGGREALYRLTKEG